MRQLESSVPVYVDDVLVSLDDSSHAHAGGAARGAGGAGGVGDHHHHHRRRSSHTHDPYGSGVSGGGGGMSGKDEPYPKIDYIAQVRWVVGGGWCVVCGGWW